MVVSLLSVVFVTSCARLAGTMFTVNRRNGLGERWRLEERQGGASGTSDVGRTVLQPWVRQFAYR